MQIAKHECIYCGSDGPFSDEHVFPAGMGGDDKSYLLSNIVCAACNSDFSKFETTLMRRSIVALARIFNQPYGRTKGEPPEFDTLETHTIDDHGRLIESSYKGSQIEPLAQLIFTGSIIESTASNIDQLISFLKKMAELLFNETLLLIEKLSNQKSARFQVSTLKLVNRDYQVQSKETLAKPPKKGIWLAYSHGTDKNKAPIPPRIFRRTKGEIVLKTHDSTLVGKLLGSAKRTLPNIIEDSIKSSTAQIQTPLISTTIEGWSNDCDRAIAKIGFNLLVKHLGTEVASLPEFSEIKQAILNKDSQMPFSLFSDLKLKKEVFGNIPKNCHCLLLTALPTSNSKINIMFLSVLYGNIGVWSILAENVSSTYLRSPAYFLVDYITNQITRLGMIDYHTNYNPLVTELLKRRPEPFYFTLE